MSGFKTLTWRALSVAALLFSATVAPAADFLFGISFSNEVNRLTVDGSVDLYSGENQGWWSGTWSNSDDNTNYLVGTIDEGDTAHLLNNFFIFDISDLTAPVSAAVLHLQFYTPLSTLGASSFSYGLFDVSTDLATLNHNQGTSWAIFNDLGSGTSYGTFLIPTSFSWDHVVSLTLNSAGLADLNAAIASDATQFAIGGTLLTPLPTDRSVPDSASTLALFGAAAVSIWALRGRKKSA